MHLQLRLPIDHPIDAKSRTSDHVKVHISRDASQRAREVAVGNETLKSVADVASHVGKLRNQRLPIRRLRGGKCSGSEQTAYMGPPAGGKCGQIAVHDPRVARRLCERRVQMSHARSVNAADCVLPASRFLAVYQIHKQRPAELALSTLRVVQQHCARRSGYPDVRHETPR